jgi:hypothetical protein
MYQIIFFFDPGCACARLVKRATQHAQHLHSLRPCCVGAVRAVRALLPRRSAAPYIIYTKTHFHL